MLTKTNGSIVDTLDEVLNCIARSWHRVERYEAKKNSLWTGFEPASPKTSDFKSDPLTTPAPQHRRIIISKKRNTQYILQKFESHYASSITPASHESKRGSLESIDRESLVIYSICDHFHGVKIPHILLRTDTLSMSWVILLRKSSMLQSKQAFQRRPSC